MKGFEDFHLEDKARILPCLFHRCYICSRRGDQRECSRLFSFGSFDTGPRRPLSLKLSDRAPMLLRGSWSLFLVLTVI